MPDRRGPSFWARAFVFLVAAAILLGTLLFVFGR
jgi:hypothetical protein